MALTEEVKVIGVKDLKIALLTTNTADAALVYGTSIDVPGVKVLTATKKVDTKTCTGDGRTLGTYRKFQNYDLKFTNAKIPLAVLAAINGGTKATSGTTPNTINTYVEKDGDDINGYFKIEYVPEHVDEVGVGDVHRVFYCVNGTLDITEKEGDYATCDFTGTAIAAEGTVTINTVEHDRPITALFINETAVDIA